jgi:gliding motility-associated-like protein
MVNDTWQITNGINETGNIIYIYDRYGKLLKQLSSDSSGWDGTFNGNKMPTSDYWFLLKRQNGVQYKGHFTLKR